MNKGFIYIKFVRKIDKKIRIVEIKLKRKLKL